MLSNHVHLIVEAESAPVLGRAMQRCCVRLARGFNRVLHRTGTVFAERYHVRALASPTEVRNALRYVLLNGNHHDRERGARALWYGCDAFSTTAWLLAVPTLRVGPPAGGFAAARLVTCAGSAPPVRPAMFDGWADDRWRHERPHTPPPTVDARTWLLRQGWRRAGGPIAFDDMPGRRACRGGAWRGRCAERERGATADDAVEIRPIRSCS